MNTVTDTFLKKNNVADGSFEYIGRRWSFWKVRTTLLRGSVQKD
jgi:hypothetical protein